MTQRWHDFYRSFGHEHEQTARADEFYRQLPGCGKIIRYDSGSEEDMLFQRQDIDVSVEINGRQYFISEKFRDIDYGDIYLEIYSKYPDVQGWMSTGSPDALVYFTPKNVCWISHPGLHAFYSRKLLPVLSSEIIHDVYLSRQTRRRIRVVLNGKSFFVTLIQAHNRLSDGTCWETIGVAVPLNLLEQSDVKMKKWETG